MNDLISRDDVYNVLKKVNIREMPIYVFDKLWNGIRDLPSIEPKERTAKVIDKSVDRHSISDFDWTGKCEKCGNEIQFSFDYCPYCGSRLGKVEK